MSKQLLVVAGPDKGRLFPLNPGQTHLVGRGRTAAILLTDPHVSKNHFLVEWDGEHLILADQTSKTGTHVNGVRVNRQELRAGDLIRVGETQLRVQDDSMPGDDSEGPETLAGPIPSSAIPGRTASPLDALVGKSLGDYSVGSILAHGGSAVIFKAQDTRQARKVALKVFAPDFLQDDEAVQRFVRAMRIMLPLHHPNLVAIHGAGKTGIFCWLAMEYVEGESLAQVMHRTNPAESLDFRFSLRVAVQIARALEYIGHNAIVHRNITPSNILIRRSDQVAKLGDWVFAKTLQGMLVENITRPGELVGEVRYMSPERVSGCQDLDGRSDIYSLGALVYHLLTGRPPFEGQSVSETLVLILQAETDWQAHFPPSLPGPFGDAVKKMLRKRPEECNRTAAELVLVLEGIAKQLSVEV